MSPAAESSCNWPYQGTMHLCLIWELQITAMFAFLSREQNHTPIAFTYQIRNALTIGKEPFLLLTRHLVQTTWPGSLISLYLQQSAKHSAQVIPLLCACGFRSVICQLTSLKVGLVLELPSTLCASMPSSVLRLLSSFCWADLTCTSMPWSCRSMHAI